MNDDATLLQEFARTGSEPAFRELVGRYIQLVNSAALRRVAGDVHLAQDVTQTVFTNLARKAAALPRDVVLGGWLHRDTCYTAAKAVRAESRRRARERTAMEINAVNENPAQDTQWQQIAPVLDDALNRLSTRDRNAIVLRYLQGCDVRGVGHALGSSENAAQIRLGRALEKLRVFFSRRGITLTAALLATALDAGARTAVPAGLTASVSATAFTGAAGSAFTLASLYNLMTSKLALSATAVLALTGLVTVLVAQNEPTAPAATVAVSNPAPAQQAAVPATGPAVPQPSVAPASPSSNIGAAAANSPSVRRSSGISRSVSVGTSPSTVAVGVSGQSGGSLTLNPDGSGSLTLTKTENGVTTTETLPAGTAVTAFNTGGNSGGGVSSGVTIVTPDTASAVVTTGSGARSGSTSQSVAVNSADGAMTVTTNNNGVVSTQTTPITGGSGTSGSTSSASDGRTGQAVMTYTDANGVTQTVIQPAPSTGSAQ